MNKIFKIFAIFISGLVIIIVSLFFFNKFSEVTKSDKPINMNTDKISNNVDIVYNKIGVPHIYADNINDLFFGIGYSHAENRLWQMDFYKRSAFGKLSEILGENYLLTDKFMRSLSINQISSRIYQTMDVYTKNALKNYCNGINFYINENRKNLPLEFSILDYIPEKWQPIDCIAIQRFLSIQMSPSILTDLIFSSISDKIGSNLTYELIPNFEQSKKYSSILNKLQQEQFIYDSLINMDMISEIKTKLEQLGFETFSGGSNSWAIKKNFNGKNQATLACDLHLKLTLPSTFMQMQVISDKFHYTGFTVPGIPFALIGRNDSISWSYTNMLVDAFDYYSEKISKNGKDYLSIDSVYNPIKFIIDTIKIRDKNPYRYYQRLVDKSVIISDFHIYDSKNNFLFRKHSRKLGQKSLSYRWIGSQPSDELTALFKLNKAVNWNQFQEALNDWSSPGVFFHYADVNGNIGIKPCALIPLRGKNNIPWKTNISYDQNTDWVNFRKTYELKSNYNSKTNFNATANNFYSDSSLNYVSYLFDHHSRIHRINDYLFKLKDFEIRDMKNMQLDIFSKYSKEILQEVIPYLKESKKFMTKKEKYFLHKISKWDYMMTGNKSEPTVFNAFILNLIYKTFHDELGDELFLDYTYYLNFSYNKILELLQSKSTMFFDNRNTPQTESIGFIVFQSFRDGLKYMEEYSKDISTYTWKWNDYHKTVLSHPLSSNKHLRSIYQSNEIGLSGSWSTLNYSNWEFRRPFFINSGVGIRYIADMSTNSVYCILPGGVSGDPTNIHFSSQLRIWANGGYFKLIHSKKRIHSLNSRYISK